MKYFFLLVLCNLFFVGVSVGQFKGESFIDWPTRLSDEEYLQLFANADNVFVANVVDSIDPDLFDFKIIENIKGNKND